MKIDPIDHLGNSLSELQDYAEKIKEHPEIIDGFDIDVLYDISSLANKLEDKVDDELQNRGD